MRAAGTDSARSWISVEPGTVALLDELHAGGTHLAIRSNANSTSATRCAVAVLPAPNVHAAVAPGATGHHFTGVDGLRAFPTGLAHRKVAATSARVGGSAPGRDTVIAAQRAANKVTADSPAVPMARSAARCEPPNSRDR